MSNSCSFEESTLHEINKNLIALSLVPASVVASCLMTYWFRNYAGWCSFLSFLAEVTPQALIIDLISSYQPALSFQPVSETQFPVPKIKLSDAGSSTFSFYMLWIHFLRSLTVHFRLKTSFGPHFFKGFQTFNPCGLGFC